MERIGSWTARGSPGGPPPGAGRLRAGLFLLGGMLALAGCYVVPAQPAYVAPAPVVVAPAPVYVAPAPVYVWGGYGWRRHSRW
jgi:hypothetical protein